MILSSIVIILAFIIFAKVGVKKTLKKIAMFLSFHWLLLIIITWRKGKSPKETIDEQVIQIVENDEEVVKGIVGDLEKLYAYQDGTLKNI